MLNRGEKGRLSQLFGKKTHFKGGTGIFLLLLLLISTVVSAAPLTSSMSFSPSNIGPGSTTTLTYQITNPNAFFVSDMSLSNDLSLANMAVSDTPQLSTNCLASVSATPGGTTVTMSEGRIGQNETCTITVNVTSSVVGTQTNNLTNLSSSEGNSTTSSADLVVNAAAPGISMAFSPASVNVNHRSTLTFTIDNSFNGSNFTFMSFSHNFPDGQLIDEFPNLSNTCGGILTATAGSNRVVLGNGAVNAGATCTISVDVIRTNSSQLDNFTGELKNNFSVIAGKAAATLGLISPSGLSLVTTFTGNPFIPGASETIQYTINNANRGSVDSISFSHDLDAVLSGLAATALPANGTCGSGSTMTGSSTLQFSGGQLEEGESCTLEVTVLVPANAAAGTYASNISDFEGQLSGSTIGNTSASDLIIKKAPSLSMAIQESQVAAGSDITVSYTITNTDTSNSATSIGFVQNTNQEPFSGSTVKTKPGANSCGSGSTFSTATDFSENTTFTVAGASLAPGANCSFDLVLTLGFDMAPSSYELTSGIIQGTVAGSVLSGNKASDTITIVSAPKLTASIVEDSVVPGGTATLTYTLTHSESAQSNATNIAFTNDLDAALTGLQTSTATQNDICGSGSSLSGTSALTFTGGILAPGESCTFSVTLDIPNSAPSGTITNTTSTVTADVSALNLTGLSADDTLLISGLTLSHSFIPSQAFPNSTIINRFTISNSAASPAATDIQFTYNLSQVLSGMTASSLPTNPCGASSSISGTTNLSFSGGELTPGANCSFDISLDVPAGAAEGNYNAVTGGMSATVNSNNTEHRAATSLLTITDVNNSLAISKKFLSNNVVPGSTVDLEFTLINTHSSFAISSITFTDDLDGLLTGLSSTSGTVADVCGTGSEISGTGLLTLTGGTIAANSSCTFQVTLQIPNTVGVSSITNTTSTASGLINGSNVSASAATADLTFLAVNGDELKITKSFQSSNVSPGENVDLLFTITNTHSSETITNIAFTDDLDSALSGLVSTSGTLNNVCRAGSKIEGTGLLSFSGGTLDPGASCAFTVTLKIPDSTSENSFTNTTSTVTGNLASVAMVGTAAVSSLNIQQVAFTSEFGSNVNPGGTAELTFKIENKSASGILSSINFSDDLDAFLTGAVATNLPLSNICGSGSTLTGTSSISLSNASLSSSQQCSFTVEISIPSSAQGGVYSNTTSSLKSGSNVIATAAIANIIVNESSSGGFSAGPTASVSLPKDVNKTVEVKTSVNPIFDVSYEEKPVDTQGGIEFPLGVISFKMLTNIGGSEDTTITFSESLPSDGFFLYKVDENNDRTIIPNSLWSQNGNSINLRLTDGGPFDLDGVKNGIIVDPVTIGVPTEDELQPFEFAPWQNVAFGQWIKSDPVTISGISAAVNVSISGGLYSIDGGEYQSTSGTIGLGQQITVIVKSADEALGTESAAVTIGSLTENYDVTTGSEEINELLTHGNQCSSASVDWVQKAYIAYYGRPADTGGVNYWSCAVDDADGSLAAIIDAFGNSREFVNQFGSLSNDELIDAIYQRLFNRDAEEAGRAYWVGQLEGGNMSLGNIALAILAGALNDDLLMVDNKLAVAKEFTYQTGASGVTIIDFYSILSSVSADSTSVSEVIATIPTLVGLAATAQDNY